MTNNFLIRSGWGFATTAEGWTGAGGAATPTVSAGILTWASSSGTNIRLLGPDAQSINGALYDKVRVRIRRTAGPTSITLRVRYTTSGHGLSTDYRKDIAGLLTGTNFVIAEFDMRELTAGGNDWITSTITRLDLQAVGSDATSSFEIDWIAYGSRPIAVMDLIKWNSVKFRASVGQQMSAQGDGMVIAQQIRPPLWAAQMTSVPMVRDDYRKAAARIEALDGSLGAFYVYDPWGAYPIADPLGTLLGSAAPVIASIASIDRRLISLSALPANYPLSEGDMLAFDYGFPWQRSLHRILESVTADGSGATSLFRVYPALPAGASAGIAVNLIYPAMLARLSPGGFDASAAPAAGTLSIDVVQAF